MPRLRNGVTGAVMSVSDYTAGRLGKEWAAVETVAQDVPKRRSRVIRKDDTND